MRNNRKMKVSHVTCVRLSLTVQWSLQNLLLLLHLLLTCVEYLLFPGILAVWYQAWDERRGTGSLICLRLLTSELSGFTCFHRPVGWLLPPLCQDRDSQISTLHNINLPSFAIPSHGVLPPFFHHPVVSSLLSGDPSLTFFTESCLTVFLP